MNETQRILELRELLHRYNNLYYVQNAPVISDIEFDKLMHELADLAGRSQFTHTTCRKRPEQGLPAGRTPLSDALARQHIQRAGGP